MSRSARTWSLSTFWRRVNALAWIPLVAAAAYLILGPSGASAGRGLLLLLFAAVGYLFFVLRPAWDITVEGPEVTFRGPLRTVTVAVRDVRAIRTSRFSVLGQWPVVVETAQKKITIEPHIADLDGFASALHGLHAGVSVSGLHPPGT